MRVVKKMIGCHQGDILRVARIAVSGGCSAPAQRQQTTAQRVTRNIGFNSCSSAQVRVGTEKVGGEGPSNVLVVAVSGLTIVKVQRRC